MKTRIQAYRLLIICAAMLITSQLFAGEATIEKTKSYSKSYTVNGSDKIDIDNKFGETKLETWANNEVKVEVRIRVVADNDSRAQSLLDNISIEDGKEGSGVYFKTNLRDHNERNGGHTEMHIDYVVHLPANNPLELDTKFGDTYMPDYNGPVTIENKFGSLKAGKLTNVKQLIVEFGKGDVESINNGALTIKYSKFTVGKLSGDIEAKFDFCDGGNIAIDNNIKSFNMHNNYSTIKINTSRDISASFDIQTHFGDFDNKTDFAIKQTDKDDNEDRGPKFDYHYMGKAGSGNIMVRIKSNFGTTTIM